ncbi:MAG: hypothetical protein IPN76_06005 [Saprospiraceae bacterium]|nr:hypothetical protein [Saprospiraceae bacterium]
MSNITKSVLHLFLLGMFLTLSWAMSLAQTGDCLSSGNVLLEKYWASKANLNENFVANTIDPVTGDLLGDGIGVWDCEINHYSMHGVGLPIPQITMRSPSTNANNWAGGSDITYFLGRHIAMLASEYALLGQSGQYSAQKRTLNELFLALQSYRRLDMTANKLWERYLECTGEYCTWTPSLDGYSGFFIRSDFDQSSETQFSQEWNDSTDITIGFASSDNNNCYKIDEPSCEGSGDDCGFKECGLVQSQDQTIGLLFGLAFVRKFVPPGQFAKNQWGAIPRRCADDSAEDSTWDGEQDCAGRGVC